MPASDEPTSGLRARGMGDADEQAAEEQPEDAPEARPEEAGGARPAEEAAAEPASAEGNELQLVPADSRKGARSDPTSAKVLS